MAACETGKMGYFHLQCINETRKFCPPQSHSRNKKQSQACWVSPPGLFLYLPSFSLSNSSSSDSIRSDWYNHTGSDWREVVGFHVLMLSWLFCVRIWVWKRAMNTVRKKWKWESISQSCNIYSQTSSWSNKVSSAKKNPSHPLRLGSRITLWVLPPGSVLHTHVSKLCFCSAFHCSCIMDIFFECTLTGELFY